MAKATKIYTEKEIKVNTWYNKDYEEVKPPFPEDEEPIRDADGNFVRGTRTITTVLHYKRELLEDCAYGSIFRVLKSRSHETFVDNLFQIIKQKDDTVKILDEINKLDFMNDMVAISSRITITVSSEDLYLAKFKMTNAGSSILFPPTKSADI